MNTSSHFRLASFLIIALSSCDSQPSGLAQQKVNELEAKLEAARRRMEDLQSKLDSQTATTPAVTPDTPATPNPTTSGPSRYDLERRDNIANAGKQLGAKLQATVGPSTLKSLGEVAWVGMTLEKAGEITGIAVPFHRTPSDDWKSVWTDVQILVALGSLQAVATPEDSSQQLATQVSPGQEPSSLPPPTPPVASVNQVPVQQTPQFPTTQPQVITPPVAVSPTPAQPPLSPPVSGRARYFVDPTDGKMYQRKPDGTLVPK